MTGASRSPRVWLVSAAAAAFLLKELGLTRVRPTALTLAVLLRWRRLGLELPFYSPLAGDVAVGLE